MLYIFAAVVFAGCLVLYLRTPAHDRLGRFFFRLGMIGAVLVALLGWLVFNVLLGGAVKIKFDGRQAMNWTIYLSGEIHTDWRDRIRAGAEAKGLPVALVSPVTDHEASDDCGVEILGAEDNKFWHDHKGAKVNAIRTRTLMEKADIVVVRFGDKYKQWNAAFDAGFAAALGKPIIVLHDPALTHALKEVDAAAMAVAETPEQVVQVLTYAIEGKLAAA